MIHLYPMIYSKVKRLAKVRALLIEYPEQKMNTVPAINGKTMEWRTADDARPGSLNEYFEVLGTTEAILHCSDGTFRVDRNDNGKWYVVYENALT